MLHIKMLVMRVAIFTLQAFKAVSVALCVVAGNVMA